MWQVLPLPDVVNRGAARSDEVNRPLEGTNVESEIGQLDRAVLEGDCLGEVNGVTVLRLHGGFTLSDTCTAPSPPIKSVFEFGRREEIEDAGRARILDRADRFIHVLVPKTPHWIGSCGSEVNKADCSEDNARPVEE